MAVLERGAGRVGQAHGGSLSGKEVDGVLAHCPLAFLLLRELLSFFNMGCAHIRQISRGKAKLCEAVRRKLRWARACGAAETWQLAGASQPWLATHLSGAWAM